MRGAAQGSRRRRTRRRRDPVREAAPVSFLLSPQPSASYPLFLVPEQETGASFEKSAERFRFRLTSHLSQATAHAYYLGVRHQHPSSSAAATSTSAQPEPTPEKESSEQATQSREDDIVVHSSVVFSPRSTPSTFPLLISRRTPLTPQPTEMSPQ